ncbi:MAG: phage tail tube protein [Chitinophagaceae bacterium]
MTVGIGAGGIMGLALEALAPPVQTTPATSGSGGTLLAGTYRAYITAINANGETTVSNEMSQVTTGTTSTINWNWSAVTGATGYKIYRTAINGASGTELLLATVGAVTTYLDTAPGSPSGAFPTVNTAFSPGTYTAPTKFFPFNSESLVSTQETVWRRPIRQSADIIGAVPGNFHVEGDLEMEALEDVVIYFLMASRTACIKSGTPPNYVYTFTPTAAALPVRTLSLTVVRNGIVFGFTGCVVGSFTFGVSDGLMTFNMSMVGRDEAVQAVPTPTWPSTTPVGAGQYIIEIPTASVVTDTDTFEFQVEDNAEPQFRLKNTTRGAEFIKFGERNSTMTMERDFESRTDFDAFKALTSQSITITGTKGTNNQIVLNAPVAIKDTYEVGLSSQGDLVRASIAYQNVIDGTGKSWQVVVKTQENMAV